MAQGGREARTGGGMLLCQTAPAKLAALRTEIRQLVADRLAGRGSVAVIGDQDDLAEIGVASLDMVALILALERRFDTEIPRAEMTSTRFRSVATLADLMFRLAPSAVPVPGGFPSAASGGGCAGHAVD